MKVILRPALIAICGLAYISPQPLVAAPDEDSTSGGPVPPLAAPVTCLRSQDSSVLFKGTVELKKGSPDDSTGDSALVRDHDGVIYPTQAFGLTGEILTSVDDHQPQVRRLELGQGLQADPGERSFIFCSFSSVSSENRTLTPDDVDELGIDEGLVGMAAQIETSIHGVVWVLPPS